jgi:hypothetical protein
MQEFPQALPCVQILQQPATGVSCSGPGTGVIGPAVTANPGEIATVISNNTIMTVRGNMPATIACITNSHNQKLYAPRVKSHSCNQNR